MIDIANISKQFGSQYLLEDASLKVSEREKIGLIGRNGSGKSTLLKMILKEEEPDSGIIAIPKNYKIGHVGQHLHFERAASRAASQPASKIRVLRSYFVQ